MVELEGAGLGKDRAGLDLVIVVDVSGSMGGKKMERMETALQFMMFGPNLTVAVQDPTFLAINDLTLSGVLSFETFELIKEPCTCSIGLSKRVRLDFYGASFHLCMQQRIMGNLAFC